MTTITEAEREIVEMIADGYEDKQIAHARGTSVHTVVNQIAWLREKLEARNRAHLVKLTMGVVK